LSKRPKKALGPLQRERRTIKRCQRFERANLFLLGQKLEQGENIKRKGRKIGG